MVTDIRDFNLESTIMCPECGFKNTEIMPTNSCQVLYECPGCQATLRPKTGECCVFCSYGNIPCPPIQESRQMG